MKRTNDLTFNLSVAMYWGALCTVHERTVANSLCSGRAHVFVCSRQMENMNHCVKMTGVL